jgi:hypothetical protein
MGKFVFFVFVPYRKFVSQVMTSVLIVLWARSHTCGVFVFSLPHVSIKKKFQPTSLMAYHWNFNSIASKCDVTSHKLKFCKGNLLCHIICTHHSVQNLNFCHSLGMTTKLTFHFVFESLQMTVSVFM